MFTLDFERVPSQLLTDVALAVEKLVGLGVSANELMLVGAHCRDVLQAAGGFNAHGTATSDLDLALYSDSLESYSRIVFGLQRSGKSGIRFRISSVPVDFIPFGGLENTIQQVLRPPSGPDEINVRFYTEVFKHSRKLDLPYSHSIQIPTIEGYVLLKLQAFADRVGHHQYKDLEDLALVLQWVGDTSASIMIDEQLLMRAYARYGEDLDIALLPALHLSELVHEIAGSRLNSLLSDLPGTTSSHMRKVFLQGRVSDSTPVSFLESSWDAFLACLRTPLQ